LIDLIEIKVKKHVNCTHGKSMLTSNKKSLKIPKWQSESVYRRRTDNTMAKRKSTIINKAYI